MGDIANNPKDAILEHDSRVLSADGKMQNLSIDKLYRLPESNVRTAQTLRLPEMIASILRNGFKINHPLVVSLKADGRALVLCGNRRYEAVETIMANAPEDFARLFPSGKIPCVAHKGLTIEQEAVIRIDHSADEDRVPLDEFGEFLAIRQLVKAGYDSQSGIAAKMGWYKTDGKTGEKSPNRSKVQPRVNLANLPAFVVAEYQKLCEFGKDATPFRLSMHSKLYSAYNKEFAKFPNGDGPEFSELWAQCMVPTAEKIDETQPTLTPNEAAKRAKAVGSVIVRDTLRIVSGSHDGSIDLASVDARGVEAETALATLGEIESYLGESDFAELVRKAQEAAPVVEAATEVEAETVTA